VGERERDMTFTGGAFERETFSAFVSLSRKNGFVYSSERSMAHAGCSEVRKQFLLENTVLF
jgi:hypothetical protein